jgi:hypothetical protein
MDALNIPTGYTLQVEQTAPGYYRFELGRTPENGQFFGEVAYWDAADGTNDIMHGETGTQEQVIATLIAFTVPTVQA